ncbi:MAG: tetratricopeptide repeat protein [Phycisphaerales bacterium]|nr:tetratricopeptide repeat protein [Phycisphaerales bacterium]
MNGRRNVAIVAAVVIAAVATSRCIVTLLPEIWFDVDPVLNSTRIPGVWPSWLMVMDVVLMAAAALGLWAEAGSRRGGSPLVMALWVLPLGVAGAWAVVGTDQVRVLLPWIAGFTGAVAMAHLGRDAAIRRTALAIMFGVAGPLALRGLEQWAWELPDTVSWFSTNRDAVLGSMGLEPGSAEALVYERRVLTGGPTGWFTSANLLATVLAACGVAWFGLVIAAKVLGRSAVVGAVGVIAVAAAAITTALTGSIGGVLVLVLGLACVLGGLAMRWVRTRANWLAMGLLAVSALAPVLAFGVATASGSTSFPGVRSMLIRWQYDVGAARVFVDHAVMGSGPAGFQDAYTAVRLSGAPEEIQSPHAMVWEWTSTLGVCGLAWAVLVVVLVWSAASRGWRLEPRTDGRVWCVVAGSLLALLPAVLVACTDWGDIDDAGRIVRVAGWISMPIFAMVAWRCLVGSIAGWAVLAAVVLLVMHAQVEMSLQNAASSVWILVLLGLAAPVSSGVGRGLPILGGAVAAALCVGAVWIGVLPQFQQDQRVVSAATQLVSAAADSTPSGLATARDRAASALRETWAISGDPLMMVHAAEQHIAAARNVQSDKAAAVKWLVLAEEEAMIAFASGRLVGGRLALEALGGQIALGESDQRVVAAVALATQLCRQDPAAAMAWINLGRLHEQSGDISQARLAFERAIACDDANTIDVLQRLPQAVRSMAQRATSSSPVLR